MLNAVVLEILVKVALMAVEYKQSVYPHLARLCMCEGIGFAYTL
jgi:hypothetical protein